MKSSQRKVQPGQLTEQLERERRTVGFDSYDMSIRQLIDMVENTLIDIAPEYQRKFVWQSERESAFIESILLGIPVPSLYLATNTDSTWEVIDGVQRISTLLHFYGSDAQLGRIGRKEHLRLTELEKLTTFTGFTFAELPKNLQTAFTLRPVKVTTLSDKSDEAVRFDLFERLNTGGVLLQAQEIRGCIYRGRFNDALHELADNTDFRATVKLQAGNEQNGTREELVLRFFAFLDTYKTFEHSVVGFLNAYMQRKRRDEPTRQQVEEFRRTFKFLHKALPHGIVRGNRKSVTPVNLFEAVSVGTALALRQKTSPDPRRIESALIATKLREFTTGATNSQRMVSGRIEFVRDSLLA